MIDVVVSVLGWGVLGLVVLAALTEGVLRAVQGFQNRFIYQAVDRRDFLDKRYHPYLAWIEDWSKPMFRYVAIGYRVFNNKNHVAPVVNNRLGFRCRDFAPPQPDELRVVILGGSAAWGFGASSNQATIAGQLEDIINSDKRLLTNGKRFATCYSLAQVDGTQTQDMLSIVGFFPTLKPDLVVSLTGWNELASNMRLDGQTMEDWGFYLAEMEGWEPFKAGSNAKLQAVQAGLYWASRHSRLVQAIAPRFIPSTGFRRGIPEAVEAGTPIFVRNIENLVRLGGAYGYKHYQFFQPNVYRKLNLAPEEARVIELYDVYRPIHGGREAGDFYRHNDIYAPAMAEIAKAPEKYGVVTNLENIFRDETSWMHYSLVHCTDPGYRRIAQVMYDTMVANPA